MDVASPKKLVWTRSTRQTMCALPQTARRASGVSLYAIQRGETPHGGATPRKEIALIRQRLRIAEQRHVAAMKED